MAVQFLVAPMIIKRYIRSTPAGKRKVVFGGHWSNNPKWLILDQGHQNISKKLRFPDASIDFIFIEHVLEHVTFENAIRFLKEVKRVLRKNGTIRIVCPFIEVLTKKNFSSSDRDKKYIGNCLKKLSYPDLDRLLKNMSLPGVAFDPRTFFLNAIFRESGHQFIWSARLLKAVMEKLGFRVKIYSIGKGKRKEYCIERKQRGVYMGFDYRKEENIKNIYDPESLAVEGYK